MAAEENLEDESGEMLEFELRAYTDRGGATYRTVRVAACEWAQMDEDERIAYMREKLFSSLMVEWSYSEV